MHKLATLAAVSLSMAFGCAPAPDAPAADVDLEAERASLRDAAASYHAAASAKDVVAVIASYDGDALMVPPSAELVEGLEGVRGYRFGFIETPGVELEFELVRVEVSSAGDMGWTLAIGEITINRAEGPPGREEVRDFHTWKKQADGSWKVVVDMWNSGVTP